MSSEGTVAPAPPGYKINSVDPEYIGNHLIISAIVTAGLSGIFLSLRLYTRRFVVRGFGWDDWWIIIAWVCAVALSIGDCFETHYGIGSHIWDIQTNKFNSYLKLEIFIGTAYTCALAFAKASICCFYLRLSPEKNFRIRVFLVIAFTAAYSTAGIIVLFFSCSPIAASWDLALLSRPTTNCVNLPAEYLAQSIINIITDILIFVLPMRTIWNLRLPFRQKLTVSSIFAVGLVVCVISVIRLRFIVVVLNSTDPSWTTNELLIWSTVEVHNTIICGCIATLKPLMNRFFPTLLGKNSISSAGIASYPIASRKNTKAGTIRSNGELFVLRSFWGNDAYVETTTSKSVRDPRPRDINSESQESIIGKPEHDIEKGGISGK